MAITALSKSELQTIRNVGSILNTLAQSVGEGEWNEIKYYDEFAAEKVAMTQAKRKQVYSEKSQIEKFL